MGAPIGRTQVAENLPIDTRVVSNRDGQGSLINGINVITEMQNAIGHGKDVRGRARDQGLCNSNEYDGAFVRCKDKFGGGTKHFLGVGRRSCICRRALWYFSASMLNRIDELHDRRRWHFYLSIGGFSFFPMMTPFQWRLGMREEIYHSARKLNIRYAHVTTEHANRDKRLKT